MTQQSIQQGIITMWPLWWEWELELTPHLLKRMEDRDFNEIDLRYMLQNATDFEPDFLTGRWIINSKFKKYPWQIIVEPDELAQLLVVITAYPIWD